MTVLHRLNTLSWHIGIFGCILLGFAVPTSRAFFNIASVFIIFGFIFSGKFKIKWTTIRQNHLFLPILLIIAMLIIGASFTSAPFKDVLDHWNRYSKFILILMIIGLLTEQQHRRWMWFAFIIGCSIVLISTYMNIFFILPWSKTKNIGLGVDHSVFIDHIAQSLSIIFFAVLMWLLSFQGNRTFYRYLFFTTCAACILSVIFLTASRIGYVIALSISLLVPFLSFSSRRFKFISLTLFLIIIWLISISDLSISRIQSMLIEVQNYRQGDIYTSTGARLHMWTTSINLWMQAPFFGHGTGSYHELAKNAFADDLMCQIGCFHPHNQFLFFAVEHGLVGVVFLLFYFIAALRIALSRILPEKILFVSFLCIVFIDALAHGPLWLFMEAYFSFGIMALLASGTSGLFSNKSAVRN